MPDRGAAMDAVELSLFESRLAAVCEEMGATLARAALSPNIKDRLDFSCAVFDARGSLCAQAAHIPVHLGSMAYAMASVVAARQWEPGEMVVFNDPFLGGTHLPDVTVVAPLFLEGRLLGFVANRAHHADIGAEAPGSMPLSRRLEEEGLVIPPTRLVRHGRLEEGRLRALLAGTRSPEQGYGDFAAQVSANRTGLRRLEALAGAMGPERYRRALEALDAYAERLAREALGSLPRGTWRFEDLMDDDGAGTTAIPIRVALTLGDDGAEVDFAGTARQVPGNINCPLSVTAAAVYYVFRCLMPPQTPASAGSLRPVRLRVPEGCLLNARRPAAVAAGNVETSTRVVDAVLGALAQAVPERIPAASQGTMNNVAMGGTDPRPWDYYETLGGGMGAGPYGGGLSAVHSHLTNTLNTPVESLEMHYPVQVLRYGVRRGSGGAGRFPGGDGLVRSYRFLRPARVTLLTERRYHAPWGLAGGQAGRPGVNRLKEGGEGAGRERLLPAKVSLAVPAGTVLTVETPGGGGWGEPAAEEKTE